VETFKQRKAQAHVGAGTDSARVARAAAIELDPETSRKRWVQWPAVNEVMAKVREELDELQQEIEHGVAKALQREEYGDILFALVSVARHLKIDPEEALRLANRKFAARFQYVESRATAVGQALRELGPAELDKFWEEAKALGTGRPPETAVT
jgi:uncharacterized protein YabN with tetrapyrrole methylase and pyrophosphatase domain